MNGDRGPRGCAFEASFERASEKRWKARWRRREAQRDLEQDLEPSASEAVRSSMQAGGATRAFRASSGEIGYVSVSGGQP